MSADSRTDPYPRNRFLVEIESLGATGFSEVRGLSARVSEQGRSEPNEPRWRRILRRDTSWSGTRGRGEDAAEGGGPVTAPTIELRRGVTDRTELWEWVRAWVDGRGATRTVRVILLNENGEPARGWRCDRARPVRWDGPTPDARAAGVATEAFELAHGGITEVPLE